MSRGRGHRKESIKIWDKEHRCIRPGDLLPGSGEGGGMQFFPVIIRTGYSQEILNDKNSQPVGMALQWFNLPEPS